MVMVVKASCVCEQLGYLPDAHHFALPRLA